MIATKVLRNLPGAYSFINATTLGMTRPMPSPAMKAYMQPLEYWLFRM